VTKRLLDHTNIARLSVQARGEGMPERMRRDATDFFNIGLVCISLHQAAEVGGGHLRAFPRWEQVARTFGVDFLREPVHPLLEFTQNFFPDQRVRSFAPLPSRTVSFPLMRSMCSGRSAVASEARRPALSIKRM